MHLSIVFAIVAIDFFANPANGSVMRHLQDEQREWLARELERKGRGARSALARHLSVRADAITRMTNLEGGKEARDISFAELVGMAEFFGSEPPGLARARQEGANPQQSKQNSEASKNLVATHLPHSTVTDAVDATLGIIPGADLVGKVDLPVFGTAEGGKGALILSNQAVDWVLRPAPLLRVADGYGMIVTGDSMSPAVKSGWTVLVNPHLPPRAGDLCVFRKHEDDGTVLACIKELVRFNDANWFVQQHNPRRTFPLKRTEWQICHVAVGSYSR